MSSTRSTRSGVTSLEVVSHLSTRERLLVAQAVYEYGANAWLDISRVLSKHPLISRPKGFFSPQACQTIYVHLMGEAGYECSDETHAPHARLNLKLAQRHYQDRVIELRSLILAEEERFKSLASEIDDIRAGRWDNEIAQELGITPQTATTTTIQVQEHGDSPSTHPLNAVEVLPLKTAEVAENESLPDEPGGQDPQEDNDTDMDVEASQSFAEVTLSREPALSTTPPPSERTQPTSTHEDQNMDAQFPAPTKPQAADIGDLKQLAAPSATDVGIEPIEKPSVESMTFSPTPAEVSSRPNITPAGATEPKPNAISREQRTQEELKAIEALEELSRQKSMDMVAPFTTTIQKEDLVSPEPTTPFGPTGGGHLPIDSQFTNLDSDVETPPVPSVPSSLRPVLQGKRKAGEVEPATSDSGRDKKKARDESVPTEDDDLGPGRRRSRANAELSTSAIKRFQAVISMLHSQISQHRNGNIFHNPIKDSEAPDYHEIVKRPMDLKTIKTRIKDGAISNSDDYQREIYLMFANAMMYNRPKSDIYRMAYEMMVESEGHIRDFRQTEGFMFRGKR